MLNRKIGAQLYTVRDTCQDAESFDKTIAQLKEIGYKLVQVSGVGPLSAKEIKGICDKHGMEIICTHRPLEHYEEKLDELIDFHKELGCKYPGLGAMFSVTEVSTVDELKEKIEGLNKIARALKAEGMTFCYHNHAFEFIKLDGKYIMDYMLELGEFDLILDVYWLAYAGQNPAEFIKKAGKKVRLVHFKDLKIKCNEQKISEVMEGNLDWESIVKACDEAGTEYAFVEQDICEGNPIDSMRTSYNNLKKLGFN